MLSLKSGEILALVGFLLLLVHNLVRRQLLKSRQRLRGLTRFWLSWGDLVVFLIILAGLTLMWSHRGRGSEPYLINWCRSGDLNPDEETPTGP